MKIAVFPGSFDPITSGHVDIIQRMLPLFDKIVVGIGNNTAKSYTFPLEQREKWIKEIFKDHSKIETVDYHELTIDLCNRIGAKFIVRGLRNTTDFNYEMSIAQLNKSMDNEIETIFTFCNPKYGHVSSTIVREIIKYKGNISEFVPEVIAKDIEKSYES